MVAIAAGVAGLARLAPPRSASGGSLFDQLSFPLVVGLSAARLTAVAFDDPSALGRVRDLLLIRGGMELWAGILAATVAVVLRRDGGGTSPLARLADLAPSVLWALAIYEGTCVVRDGCFGPAAAWGLRPPGVGYAQVPVGLGVAAALGVLGVVVRRLGASDPLVAAVTAYGGLAAVRSVAAVWLPRISPGLTRHHRESLSVLGGAVVIAAVLLATRSGKSRRQPGSTTASRSSGRISGRKDGDPALTEENQQCS